MLQLNLNLSEVRNFAKKIPDLGTAGIMGLMRLDLKKQAVEFLNGLLSCEFDLFLGREKYERHKEMDMNGRYLRNGTYQRSIAIKGLGRLKIKIPRDRAGIFKTGIIEAYKRNEACLEEDIALLYLMGQSTRSLALISQRLLGVQISASKVSECSQSLMSSRQPPYSGHI